MKKFIDVNEYISAMPRESQAKLKEIRATIKEAAPGAEERVSYGMPGYKLNGPLVYFAANKNHIGFYPTSADMTSAVPELEKFRTGKGTLQFPLTKPLPLGLIRKAVKFRVKQNQEKKKKY